MSLLSQRSHFNKHLSSLVELVEISSALTDWYTPFEVCEFFRNYYNQNAKLWPMLMGPPKTNYSIVSMFQ